MRPSRNPNRDVGMARVNHKMATGRERGGWLWGAATARNRPPGPPTESECWLEAGAKTLVAPGYKANDSRLARRCGEQYLHAMQDCGEIFDI